MRRCCQNSCKSAFTLPEIIVSLALVSFVLVALAGLLREAVRFYTDQSITVEVQKNCVLAVQRLGKDLREASPDSFSSTPPSSVMFGSPRDNQGLVSYDEGRLMWQKFIRFTIEEVDGSSVLLRQEDWLDQPTSRAPDPSFSDFTQPDLNAVQARYIESLDVSPSDGGAKVEIVARYKDVFEMKLETELRLQN